MAFRRPSNYADETDNRVETNHWTIFQPTDWDLSLSRTAATDWVEMRRTLPACLDADDVEQCRRHVSGHCNEVSVEDEYCNSIWRVQSLLACSSSRLQCSWCDCSWERCSNRTTSERCSAVMRTPQHPVLLVLLLQLHLIDKTADWLWKMRWPM